jgi:hypothetical protein
MAGWHCDCRMFSDEDDDGNEVLEPCCWCGDNDPSPDNMDCPNEDASPCKSETPRLDGEQ